MSDSDHKVCVVSYNVHSCVGADRRRDPQRVAEVINRLEPDIVGLQEVDTSLDETRSLGQLEVLAELTGLQPYGGPTIAREQGFFGNALLSRFDVTRVRRLDLSVEGCEPRGALDVDVQVEADAAPLRVATTHLGLSAGERREQVGRLLSHLFSHPRGRATLVIGDFNEWFRFSRNLRRLNSYLGWQPPRATFPARAPVAGLDRIWVTPRRLLVDAGVDRSELARLASDHLPIWTKIHLD
jgi:endonuclease/exonuclease/phosphatase family metal-dependent hydrolase